MKRFVRIFIWLAVDCVSVLCAGSRSTPTVGSKDSPRLLSPDVITGEVYYQLRQNHSVLFYQEDSGEVYVGVTDFVYKLDLDDCRITEKFHLNTTGHCKEGNCDNVITVIEKFQDSVFVCGTNGHKPQCWKLFPSVSNQSHEIVESYEGAAISPFTYTQNSLSLTVEEDLYTVAPQFADGRSLQFRRKVGSRSNTGMNEAWITMPTFIAADWVKREEDADNEKIYIFFREKNLDNNPEADPWISRVARVCKADEGGPKRFQQGIWTSFLKARLVCGFPEESLYFNLLQDVYVLHAKDWHDTRVYALFTSSWNSSAVCIYPIDMIEEVFQNSTLKGYNKDLPTPRPGTCVKNSRSMSVATISVLKDHPEMNDWVHSMHYKRPFYISNNNYTKIVVDRVQAADRSMHNVLLLATDSGKIHKVLEADLEPFIISETQISTSSTIQSMKLDPKKKKLVLGFSEKISVVDLRSCQEYNKSCEDCVLARDPYCAWTESGCTSDVLGGIQDIADRQISVCSAPVGEPKEGNRTKRETLSAATVDLESLHSVPLNVPFYLSCPIDSYHAVYTWEHKDQSNPCLQMQSNCLLLIPAMAKENYGSYECVSKEMDYIKVMKRYTLIEQRNIPEKLNNASPLVPQMWIILGLNLAAMLGLLR